MEALQTTTYGQIRNGNGTNGNEHLPAYTHSVLDDIDRRQRLAQEFAGNIEETQQILNASDVVAVSLDLDGVVIEEYDEAGNPHLDGNVTSLAKFADRTRNAFIHGEGENAGKEFIVTLNTNREVPIVGEIMTRLDPKGAQKEWWAVLEGGHVLAYRHTFDPSQIEMVPDADGKAVKKVRLSDDSYATVVEEYSDGSVLALEELIETSVDHRNIVIGHEQLSLKDARTKMVSLLQAGIQDGSFGEAYIPQGRHGMVTIRGLSEDQVVPPGHPSIADMKKYHVLDNAPIAQLLAKELGVSSISELHAKMYYYPGDRGFDIQFDGFTKETGQKAMIRRMRELGTLVKENSHELEGEDKYKSITIAHVGDSGSDDIPFEDKTLKARNVVVAVGNADHKLATSSYVQTPYEYVRGVKHTLYVLQQMAMGNVDATTIEKYSKNHNLEPFIDSYLGRHEPQPGDIDMGEILNRIDFEQLEVMKGMLEKVKERKGRVFVIGNGGSFDNARLVANQLADAGIEARTPGDNRSYQQTSAEKGYEFIFCEALKEEDFGPDDMVIGISGSGNSPNILQAEAYALRVRMQSLQGDYNALVDECGLFVDCEVFPEPGNVDMLMNHVFAKYERFQETWNTAWEQAQLIKERDPEKGARAIELLTKMKDSQNIISLGGRDGGKMKKLTGETYTHIAPTPCMEALEDEHPIVMTAIAKAVKGEVTTVKEGISTIKESVLETLRSDEVLPKVKEFVTHVERTIFNGGRIVIVGNPDKHPSVTHAQADWMRGMVNMLPIKGPEVRVVGANTNAWMATANDDGAEYGYVDEMTKLNLSANDVVLFIGDESEQAAFELCRDEISGSGAHVTYIGTEKAQDEAADIPAGRDDVDLTATMLLHTTSRAVNEHLRSPNGLNWSVKEADIQNWPNGVRQYITERMGTQRKLNKRDTLALEDELRAGGLLRPDEVITWCYGKAYIAKSAEKFHLERGFY